MNVRTMLETRVRAIWAMAAVVAAGLGGFFLVPAAAGAAGGAAPAPERAAIEKIVREYILSHPEILPEAMQRLEDRQNARLLSANRSILEAGFPGTTAGNPTGDVTLVVFFDYACPYCRKGHADVKQLVASDPGVRIVYRDFPVLSPASEEAAMASLSAATQGRYRAFHDAMFDSPGKVGHDRTLGLVGATGLDVARTTSDLTAPALKAEVARNLALGRALGLTGTPSYIVGDRILSGAVGFDRLKEAVDAARAARQG
ncbi:DsbA family protein [Sandarakinorhabdus sp.]|uniref:DsbA family protein n=1 Tax=Sandarakinorhabdus sp. TaxID=1916663 RepID=UPI00286E9B92|nr:DsbA family protein [Sandarakinorhabdus sp.]